MLPTRVVKYNPEHGMRAALFEDLQSFLMEYAGLIIAESFDHWHMSEDSKSVDQVSINAIDKSGQRFIVDCQFKNDFKRLELTYTSVDITIYP